MSSAHKAWAEYANTAIEAFRKVSLDSTTDYVTASDLIADVLHWCTERKIDTASVLKQAMDYFDNERKG
jgi:hypothetical protein